MNSAELPVRKIISGGQTGVDRAALDTAIALYIDHGGWCPLGRRAEDGPIPEMYRLQTTESPDYKFRTERNVQDSDGTLILYRRSLRGGTLLTHKLALENGKPCLAVDLDDEVPAAAIEVRHWLLDHQIGVLNVAGPRESQSDGIAAAASRLLTEVLTA